MVLFKETWANALFIAALALVGIVLIIVLVKIWARCSYNKIQKNPETPLDIDTFVNAKKNPIKYVYCVMVHRLSIGYRKASSEPIPLTSHESPYVEGLQVTAKNTEASPSPLLPPFPHVVIGTIRMGFGHHRIAYATASWALEQFGASNVFFHDFLNIDSSEANLLKDTDSAYSKGSRLASEIGGPVERLWGSLMLSGDANALRVAGMSAAHLRPLLMDIPKDTPFIATHQLVALTAVAAGFTHVINLVIDNHPQWFLTVPQCLNLVQGPVNYQSFLKMGIPPDLLGYAGHWCPAQLVHNLQEDCTRRIQRAKAGFENNDDGPKCPRRILIPVGGAGAQRKFILHLVEALAPMVKANKIQLLLNAGDHQHMQSAFKDILATLQLDYDLIDSLQGVKSLQQQLLDVNDVPKSVTLFCFTDYFPAVATTDIMCRVADVLACKPSEMAFYPLPKLLLRRVGDHEADSAKRASELGDGTMEAREVKDCLEFINLFVSSPDLLVQMNEFVIKNGKEGIYNGCKNAVQRVVQMMKWNANNMGPEEC